MGHLDSALNANKEAIKDYDLAISFSEGIRKDRGGVLKWTSRFRNILVLAYMNRGNARYQLGAHKAAIEDCDLAISLGEGIQEKGCGQNWTVYFRDDLASAYICRGDARRALGEHTEAYEDYGKAIDLREGIREYLGGEPNWTVRFR